MFKVFDLKSHLKGWLFFIRQEIKTNRNFLSMSDL